MATRQKDAEQGPSWKQVVEGVPGGVPPEKIESLKGPDAIILAAVKKSAFFGTIAGKTGIGISGPFAEKVVSAIRDIGLEKSVRVVDDKIRALGYDFTSSSDRGEDCAMVTLEVVSELASAGEFHGIALVDGEKVDFTNLAAVAAVSEKLPGVVLVEARRGKVDSTKLGPVLEQLSGGEVRAILETIEANPGVNRTKLSHDMRVGIQEVQIQDTITTAVEKSAFFKTIARETGIDTSSLFAGNIVAALSVNLEKNLRAIEVGAQSGFNGSRIRALGYDFTSNSDRGEKCAMATLMAVSKLASAGELHGVAVLGARGREIPIAKLGPVLGQLSGKQVEAILKAIEENPGQEIMGLTAEIQTSIQEAQK